MNLLNISLRAQELIFLTGVISILMLLVFLMLNVINKEKAQAFKKKSLLIFGVVALTILFISLISRIMSGQLFSQQTKTEIINK